MSPTGLSPQAVFLLQEEAGVITSHLRPTQKKKWEGGLSNIFLWPCWKINLFFSYCSRIYKFQIDLTSYQLVQIKSGISIIQGKPCSEEYCNPVWPLAMHRCTTWIMKAINVNKLTSFQTCYRWALHIIWMDHKTNESVREEFGYNYKEAKSPKLWPCHQGPEHLHPHLGGSHQCYETERMSKEMLEWWHQRTLAECTVIVGESRQYRALVHSSKVPRSKHQQ